MSRTNLTAAAMYYELYVRANMVHWGLTTWQDVLNKADYFELSHCEDILHNMTGNLAECELRAIIEEVGNNITATPVL